MKNKKLTKWIALLLCGIICLAMLAGCVNAGAENIEKSEQEETSEAVSEESAASEAPEASSEPEESSEEEQFAWDVKPFDWDAVLEDYTAVTDWSPPRYHRGEVEYFFVWDDSDVLAWTTVRIWTDGYYKDEPDLRPAKERAEHIIAYLEENNRRYAYISNNDQSYEMIAPLSYNDIVKLNEFGGYVFSRAYGSPRNEDSWWHTYEGPLTIIYG